MTRNMIQANFRIFNLLDQYCADRNDPIRNAAKPRWIETTSIDREVLINSVRTEHLAFSPSRALIRLDNQEDCYICTLGFENVEIHRPLVEIDVNPGLLTTILSEIEPRPRASTSQIRNIVEVSNKGDDESYKGHTTEAISSLFAPIRAFRAKKIVIEDTWRLFFLLCVDECKRDDSWIDDRLIFNLKAICELEMLSLPYRTLCRSIFDADPSSLFLALYRCLEALYAHSSALRLIQALKLEMSWVEVATALEDQLDWHPREESSLGALFRLAQEQDLERLFAAFNMPLPGDGSSLANAASRQIYRLRNGLVHFRPAQHKTDYTGVDWNRLCETMAVLAWHVYSEVFPLPN